MAHIKEAQEQTHALKLLFIVVIVLHFLKMNDILLVQQLTQVICHLHLLFVLCVTYKSLIHFRCTFFTIQSFFYYFGGVKLKLS